MNRYGSYAEFSQSDSHARCPAAPRCAHHTLNITWQEKEEAIAKLEQAGARVENIREHSDG